MLGVLRAKVSHLHVKTKQRVLSVLIIFLLFLGLGVLNLTASSQLPSKRYSDYEQFIRNYTKKYTAEEEAFRKFVFYQTHDAIFSNKQLNQSYYQGVNEFADLTEQEFRELYFIVTSVAKQKDYLEIAEFQKKYYYNWTEYMPPVKNMKDYDGSHIFSVVSLLQFEVNKQIYLKYKAEGMPLEESRDWVSLSEQEVIDCCEKCRLQRSPKLVYFHLQNYGINLNKKYPYINSIYDSNPKPCQTSPNKQFKIKGYFQISSCAQISERLEFSPVVVGVDARTWRTYNGGILNTCSTVIKRNHYALLVGKGINYWLIRNSWGRRWGERGHIRIKSGNHCGVCSKGTYLTLK